ncbi:MAG: MMPL family transporter, partial [Actinomycetota bacterium]|nr:MMPL family transporter [Actinomycetota bacterium]
MNALLQRVVAFAARRPVPVVVATILLTLAAALLALRLEPSTGADTLVGKGSDSYEATQRYYDRFGDDAVIVLVEGSVAKTMLTADQGQLLRLEQCLGGRVPPGVEPIDGWDSPCGEFAREKPAQAIYGPASFVLRASEQLKVEFARQQKETQERAERAARAVREIAAARGWSEARIRAAQREARQAVQNEFLRDTLRLALRYGITGEPRPDDPNFVSKLIFDARKPAGTPKARFAYLFPTKDAALIQIRLRPDLSDAERTEVIEQIQATVRRDRFKLAQGGRYTVTGAPVVLTELADEVTRSIGVLLLAALLVMAATLALVFRVRMRLLPLAVALAAAGLTFGALSLVGASLTMASIAVLPVLIGLAVDYAIQLQSRTLEEAREGQGLGPAAAQRMAVRGAPTVATAAAATIAGFLVLVLSPVPMVRGFGLLLVVGIV